LTDQSLAGRRFGAYEVLEELGSGGMGKVYRAKNVTLERLVALKTLAPHLSADQGFVQRFLKEARVAARLNHPNIVQTYDFGCVEGVYYLAMEYVDGHSLRTYLKRGRFSERDALQVIRYAVRALAVAHEAGIVHRDIKPDNLMLTAKGELKVVDMGIAKRLDEEAGSGLTQTGQAVGTPQYISPEQIRSLKDIDARADIYSLGATMYHLVTGHPPFKGSSGALVMTMHLTHPLPDPRKYEPSLSEGLCRVLRKMMAKEREERYQDVYALDNDLYRLQMGELPEAEEPSTSGIETMVESHVPTPPGARPSSLPGGSHTPTTPRTAGRTRSAAPGPETPPLTPRGEGRPLTSRPEPRPLTQYSDARPTTSRPPDVPQTSPPPSTAGSPSSATTQAFREEDLHFVEVELAKHIGPLARVLVKKAAKSASNLVALGAALAENIPDEEGRRAFRSAIRARAK
jgi:serine/threonine-protein kinase